MVRFLVLLAAFVGLCAASVVYFGVKLNVFAPLAQGPDAQCSPIIGVAGPEDMEHDPNSGLTYISSFDRQAAQKDKDLRGAILGFKLDTPLADSPLLDSNWRDRTVGIPEKFQPVGLSLFANETLRQLVVVNAVDNSIILYKIEAQGELTYQETFTDPRLTSPNDVVAVGPRQFYVTNDVGAGRGSLIGQAEFLLGLGTGRLLYFDGNSWSVVANDLAFANGVELNDAADTLIVSETSAKRVTLFDREPEDGTLTNRRSISLDSFPDNLSWDQNGDLLIGAHPKPLDLTRHMANPAHRSPSQIYKLSLSGSASVEPSLQLVYQDDGTALSGATVAVMDQGRTIIGALVDNKILICE